MSFLLEPSDNKANILFIFEGARYEEKYLTWLLEKTQILDQDLESVRFCYCNNIYDLYEKVLDANNEDSLSDIDIVSAIRDLTSCPEKNNLNLESKKFSEIYLFFDYDPHAHKGKESSIKSLLKNFDNENTNGKLFISYPMLESLRHAVDDNFKNLDIEISKDILKEYKKTVGLQGLENIDKKNARFWSELIDRHLKKSNKIVNNNYSLPSNVESVNQKNIYKSQINNHINPFNRVAILSSIPMFYFDYTGKKLK